MLDVEAILEDAGARWRASQPPITAIDVGAVLADVERGRRASRRLFRAWAVGAAVVVVAALALAFVPTRRPPAPAGVGATPGGRADCAVTVPKPVFVAPSPFLAADPIPAHAWFGTARLWTSLAVNGESWGPPTKGFSMPVSQKTFWWSVDWPSQIEFQPAIRVTGSRLDGPGSFSFGDPGTNASADFGTAMLVGIDVPTEGCWRITGRYRDAELSYVVWVEGG